MGAQIDIIRDACKLVLGNKFKYSVEEHSVVDETYIVFIENLKVDVVLSVPFDDNHQLDCYCIQLYHYMRKHAHIELNELYERYTVVIDPYLQIGLNTVKLEKGTGSIAVPKPVRTPTEIIHVTIEHTNNDGQDIRIFNYKITPDGVYQFAQKYSFSYGISASSYALVTDTRDPYAAYIMCPHDFYPHACNEPIHEILADKWAGSYYGRFIQLVSPETIFLKLDGFWVGINLNQFFQRLKSNLLPQYIIDEWNMHQMLGGNS